MKPISLVIAGLNSFRDKVQIDFAELCGAGIFGIFGQTGSGKSTILDAITLALYGSVERTGKAHHGIINDAEERLTVEFSFALGKDDDERIFKAGRVYEREKKAGRRGHGFDDFGIKFKKGHLIEVKDGKESVIVEKSNDISSKVEEIIGLNVDDFTRAVVLPQGKFAEFLLLRGEEKKQMLERLFSLAEYGEKLSRKVKERLRSCESSLERILSSQTTLDVSREGLKSLEEDKIITEEEKKNREEAYREIQEKFEAARSVWERQQKLQALEREEKEIRERQNEIRTKENELERAGKAEALRKIIDDEKALAGELREKERAYESCEKILQNALHANKLARESLEKAIEEKKIQEPKMRERLTLLKTALELEAETRDDEKKAKQLLRYLKEKGDLKDSLAGGIESAKKEKRGYDADIALLKRKQQDCAIDPEFRKTISGLIPLLEQMKAIRSDLEKLEKGRASKEKGALRLRDDLDKLEKSVQDLETQLEHEEKMKIDLKAAPPGGDQELHKMAIQIEKMKSLIRLIGKAESERENRIEKLKDAEKGKALAEKEIDRITKAIEEKSGDLRRTEQSLIEAEKKLKRIEKHETAASLAGDLREGEPCPVCGSPHHPDPASLIEGPGANLIEESIAGLRKMMREIERALQEIAGEKVKRSTEHGLAEKNIEEKQSDIKRKEEEIALTRGELQEESRELPVGDLKELLSRKEDLYGRLREEVSKHNEQCDRIEERLDRLRKASKTGKDKKAELQSRHAGAAGSLGETGKRIEDQKEELSRLQVELNSKRGSVEEDKIMVINREIEEKDSNAAEFIKNIREFEEKALKLQERIEEKRDALREIETDITGKKATCDDLVKKLERDKEKLTGITGGASAEALYKLAKDALESLEKNLEKRERDQRESQRVESDALIREAKARESKEGAIKNLEKRRDELERSLEREGFANSREAEDSLRDPRWREKAREDVENYKDRLRLCSGNIEKLRDELSGKMIEVDCWNELLRARVESEKERDAARENAIIAHRKLLDASERFRRWLELEELREKEQKLYDNLQLLEKTIKGKAFVEFLAEEQLRNIALDASAQLGNLTRQRYALEIASDGAFIIRDNANGGFRRPVNTLSGGEIFITSLSLALSLSSHIQLKGRYLLEFFFLDEGFGSLDPDLLETVMNSLEKLRMDNLNIGIISHVPELRNRICRRLIVTGAEPGIRGSMVRIEK